MNRRAAYCGGALALSLMAITAATARPVYLNTFKAHFQTATGKPTLNAANCAMCHIGAPPMKNFNAFGMAFTKALGATGINDPVKISAAFDAAAKIKNPATGETFGARIAKDALPAGATPVGGGGGVTGTWVPIFNGINMDGWTKMNAGNWSVSNYVLYYGLNSGNGWLRSAKQYTNYSMVVVWKYTEPGTGTINNAGIFLKAPAEGNPWPTGPEINMGPGQNIGSIGGASGTRARFDLIKPNDWNTYAVTVQNGQATLAINGTVAWEQADGLPTGPGYIGIQCENRPFQIAQVWLMELP
jgi:hypothetical protein